jgi:hypothetical protein
MQANSPDEQHHHPRRRHDEDHEGSSRPRIQATARLEEALEARLLLLEGDGPLIVVPVESIKYL